MAERTSSKNETTAVKTQRPVAAEALWLWVTLAVAIGLGTALTAVLYAAGVSESRSLSIAAAAMVPLVVISEVVYRTRWLSRWGRINAWSRLARSEGSGGEPMGLTRSAPKGCSRCGGDLLRVEDGWACFSCGWRVAVSADSMTKYRSPSRKAEESPSGPEEERHPFND